MANTDTDKTIKKVTTGIKQLDDMLFGGIPEGSQTALIGQPGTGKSIFAFQILYANAKQGIPSTVYLTDQTKESFLKNVKSAFGNFDDIDELIEKKTINLTEHLLEDKFTDREGIMLFITRIIEATESNNSKLIMIDEMSLLRALLHDDREFTRMINEITEDLNDKKLTGLITLELPYKYSKANIPGLYEESMFDGIIKLENIINNDANQNTCTIIKMRFTKFKPNPCLLDITPDGLVMTALK